MPSSATPTPTDALSRFRRDLPFYGQVCLRIETKGTEQIPLRLWRAQQLVHDKISRQRQETGRVRVLILKARQEGISTYVAGRFFRRLHLWPRTRALVAADEADRAAEIFAIYERYAGNLPSDLRFPTETARRGNELSFSSGSRIVSGTAGNVKIGRGKTIQCLHVTEIGFWERAAESWNSVIQAVPDEGSEIIVESTANGWGQFFHQLWTEAEAGLNEFIPIFIPWWIHDEYSKRISESERTELLDTTDPWERLALEEGIPFEGEMYRLTPEQLAWRRWAIANKSKGDLRAFQQEYPATAREAFLVTGDNFFDTAKLEVLERESEPPGWRGRLASYPDKGIGPSASPQGSLRVWEPPARDGHYVIGVDTAEGLLVGPRRDTFDPAQAERGGRDFSSADVIRCGYWHNTGERDESGNPILVWKRPRLVAQLHGYIVPEVFAEQLWMLGNWYSCPAGKPPENRRDPALIAVERNHSSGQTVLRILREEKKYPHLFWERRFNERTQQITPRLGWVTDGDTRMPMLDDLARAVREETLGIPAPDTIREMFGFVYDEKDGQPRAQENLHDDRVISLAIALQMALHHHAAEPAGELPDTQVADTPTGL